MPAENWPGAVLVNALDHLFDLLPAILLIAVAASRPAQLIIEIACQ